MNNKETVFRQRLSQRREELCGLYLRLCPGQPVGALLELLEDCWNARRASLRERDALRERDWYRRRSLLGMTLDADAFAGDLKGVRERLGYLRECGVNYLHLTSLPDGGEGLEELAAACAQADILLGLDLAAPPGDPAALLPLTRELLLLANRGADVLRPDAGAWGGADPSGPARLLRLACEIVCPGVLLLGGPGYAGGPETYHLLSNPAAMAAVWHTVATGDVSLLRRLTDGAGKTDPPRLNCLRCRDSIRWDLDFPWLREQCGIEEAAHKKFLNACLTGSREGSDSRGELYAGPQGPELCGTTASLCGVEAADYERDPFKMEQAVSRDLTLHAWLLSQSGVPVLCGGDEVGQLNDYTYHDDPGRRSDSRNLHRGRFRWDLADYRRDRRTRQGKQFTVLRRLTELRAAEPCFGGEADVWTEDSGSEHVLVLVRRLGERELVCLFNFSGEFVTAGVNRDGSYTELMYGGHYDNLRMVQLWPDGFAWLLRDEGRRQP